MSRADEPTGSFAGSAAELPVEQALLLDEACDAFEAKWRAGGRPDIWAAVSGTAGAVAARRAAGVGPARRVLPAPARRIAVAADYAHRFPELDADWLGAVVASDPVGRPSATAGARR